MLSTGNPGDRTDYMRGITAFSIFLCILTICWGVTLLVLKLHFGPGRVGCAASGGPIDAPALRKQGVSRRQRKQRIVRAWRTQATFMTLSMMIPLFSALLVNHGLRTFIESLHDVTQFNDDVDSLAYRGIEIIHSLDGIARNLQADEFLNDMRSDFGTSCPDSDSTNMTIQSLGFETLREVIVDGADRIESLLQNSLYRLSDALSRIVSETQAVDDTITSVYQFGWIFKLFLVLVNVINLFLWIGVVLSKVGVEFHGYQVILSWAILPAFGLCILATVSAAGTFLAIALFNADFCAGGPSPGSPHGTFRSLVQAQGFHETSLPYRSLEYFLGECQGENPLEFVSVLRQEINDAGAEVLNFVSVFTVNHDNITESNAVCGHDVSKISISLSSLGDSLMNTAGYLEASMKLTDCSSVKPVIAQLQTGSICTESVDGLAWIFGGLLALWFICLMMFSTRAALYNPVYKAKRRLRREREFEEYRVWMAQFYEDTEEWMIDPVKKYLMATPHPETFDTDETSRSSELSKKSDSSSTNSSHLCDSQIYNKAETLCQTPSHKKYSEQIMMTPLAKAAVAAGLVAAEAAAKRALNGDTGEDDESCASSESSDSFDQPSVVSNISVLVDRFFSVRRNRTLSTSIDNPRLVNPSNTSSQNAKTDYPLPSNLLGALDMSFQTNEGDDDILAREPPTPSPARSQSRGPTAPIKLLKSLGRTQGGSKLEQRY
jgi:hypothetical protein